MIVKLRLAPYERWTRGGRAFGVDARSRDLEDEENWIKTFKRFSYDDFDELDKT